MSSYSVRENPFSYGLARVSYQDTNDRFGKWSTSSELDENGLPSFTSEIAFSSMNKIEHTAFYSGRFLRFGVSAAGTVADFALQFFQCFLATPISLLINAELLLRNCKLIQTYSKSLLCVLSIPLFLRDRATVNQFYYFLDDVQAFANYMGLKKMESFASELKDANFARSYCAFLHSKILQQRPAQTKIRAFLT